VTAPDRAGQGPRPDRTLTRTAGHPAQLVIGLTLWFVWFSVLYGGLAVACAVAPPAVAQGALNGASIGMLALTVVTGAALGWMAWAVGRSAGRAGAGEAIDEGSEGSRPGPFIARVSAVLHGIAAVCTLVVGIPLVWLPPCL
jgi:hypothetical protein